MNSKVHLASVGSHLVNVISISRGDRIRAVLGVRVEDKPFLTPDPDHTDAIILVGFLDLPLLPNRASGSEPIIIWTILNIVVPFFFFL